MSISQPVLTEYQSNREQTHRHQILAVDDDPGQLQLVASYLANDYDVILATDAGKALQLLEAGEHPDLILADVMMPDMSGFEFCEQLKRIEALRSVPVIFVSALNDDRSELFGLGIGAVDFIHKPVNLPILKARIRAQLSARQLVQHLSSVNNTFSGKAQQELAETISLQWCLDQDRLCQEVFHFTHASVVVTDADGYILTVNPAFCQSTGFSGEEVVGAPSIIYSSDQEPDIAQAMRTSLASQGHWTGELYNRRKSGERFPEMCAVTAIKNDAGSVQGFIVVASDISVIKAHRRQRESEYWQDAVTGLPNRMLISEKTEAVLNLCKSSNTFTCLIHVDLNEYRRLLDSVGFEPVAKVVTDFVERIRKVTSKADILGSAGADKLLILLSNTVASREQAMANAMSVLSNLEEHLHQPFHIDGIGELRLSISAGVVVLPDELESGEAVLSAVDVAHHYAKEAKLGIAFYKHNVSEQLRSMLVVQSMLSKAVMLNQLLCYVQPQVDCYGQTCGVETLMRWSHPERGLIPPGEFIPVAEASGQIIDLDRWMLGQACHLTQLLADRNIRVAVNVSALYFESVNFVSELKAILAAKHGVANLLVVEVTERLIIANVSRAVAKMQEVRDLGVHLSIDDFGTGYSSLSYIRQLPINELKIDRSFIVNALAEKKDAEIVALIASLAETLNLRVVAEGVETAEQAQFLADRYPDMEQQGYFYARPVPYVDWLATQQPRES